MIWYRETVDSVDGVMECVVDTVTDGAFCIFCRRMW
jgi:hypothetical protein